MKAKMKDALVLMGVFTLIALLLGALIASCAWEIGKVVAVWKFIFG